MTRRAFTLVELLVVIGMVAVLMGAMGSSVAAARRRAKIAIATQEVKEMTNAIIAFENYAPNKFAKDIANGAEKSATKDSLYMILGQAKSDSGEDVPMLYNANIVGSEIRDPWGTPYKFMVKKVEGGIKGSSGANQKFVTAFSLPNIYRLSDEERQ